MEVIDRHTVGLAVMPRAAKSMPLGSITAGAVKPLALVEEARVTCSRAPTQTPTRSPLALLVA